MTTRCLPKGVCSWDFRLQSDGVASEIRFDIMREAGEIETDGLIFEIKKTNLFTGHWTLWFRGQQVAEASKPSSLYRSFSVSADGSVFTVEPVVLMSNRFVIKTDEVFVGRIEPDHVFTRRATIHMDHDMPRHLMHFSFWLVALMWRRDA